MIHGYRIIYYKLYTWFRQTWGQESAPLYITIFFLSMVFLLNVGSIMLIIFHFTGVRFLEDNVDSGIITLVYMITCLLHYLNMSLGSRHNTARDEYVLISDKMSNVWSVITIAYVFGSPFLFVTLMFIV